MSSKIFYRNYYFPDVLFDATWRWSLRTALSRKKKGILIGTPLRHRYKLRFYLKKMVMVNANAGRIFTWAIISVTENLPDD